MRSAQVNRTRVKLAQNFCGGRHQTNAAIDVKSATANIQYGAAGPHLAMARPATAGPTARLTL